LGDQNEALLHPTLVFSEFSNLKDIWNTAMSQLKIMQRNNHPSANVEREPATPISFTEPFLVLPSA
jgi:hypothetical protein